MLDAGIIKPVEESDWISPMVVQDKKTVLRPGNSQETIERDSPQSTFPTSP